MTAPAAPGAQNPAAQLVDDVNNCIDAERALAAQQQRVEKLQDTVDDKDDKTKDQRVQNEIKDYRSKRDKQSQIFQKHCNGGGVMEAWEAFVKTVNEINAMKPEDRIGLYDRLKYVFNHPGEAFGEAAGNTAKGAVGLVLPESVVNAASNFLSKASEAKNEHKNAAENERVQQESDSTQESSPRMPGM